MSTLEMDKFIEVTETSSETNGTIELHPKQDIIVLDLTGLKKP